MRAVDRDLQKALDFYVDRAVLTGSGTLDDAAVVEFRREAPRWGLTERQIETLIKWERAWSGPSD